MVEHNLAKVATGVRFPSSAPKVMKLPQFIVPGVFYYYFQRYLYKKTFTFPSNEFIIHLPRKVRGDKYGKTNMV